MSRKIFTLLGLAVTLTLQASEVKTPRPLQCEHLPNAFLVTDDILSGGTPNGEEGFTELEKIGVKTVISVDGSTPEIDSARQHGIRYVHLPHGYDGIPDLHARTLAKAVRELPGPIYIHCHHGKHRSPASTAVACIGAGLISVREGLQFLNLAGTSQRYVGLYAAVNRATNYPAELLEQMEVTFPELAQITPLARAMVNLEAQFNNLASIGPAHFKQRTNRSETDPAHEAPMLPAHEALMLKEHFAEIMRTAPAEESFEEYRKIIRNSHQLVSQLESHLYRHQFNEATKSELTKTLSSLKRDCRRCHAAYRDRAGG